MPFVGFQATHRGHNICCIAKAPKKYKDVDEFWKGDYLRSVRDKMNAGVEIPECRACYKDEADGKVSQRQRYNKLYESFQSEDLPTAMDLDFSNLCNLKCVMCGPDRSSQWVKELGLKEGNPALQNDQIDKLCAMSKNLKHITIQGGEPSIMPEFEYYFDYLQQNDISKNISVDCISNLTNINQKFYKMLEGFKQVNLNVSVDAYGDACNYIRFPSNFDKISDNISRITKSNIQVNLQISLQVLSMFNFYDFLVWIHNKQQSVDRKLGLQITFVKQPDMLDIENAPSKLKDKFISDIIAFENQYNLKHDLGFNMSIQNIKKTLQGTPTNTDKTKELLEYIHQIDTRRNIKVTNFIPNFHNFL